MSSNLIILSLVFTIIILLSIVWNVFYLSHIKKDKIINKKNIVIEVFQKMNICGLLPSINATCPVLLSNTDDDISEALIYVKPSQDARTLLESLYEQRRV